MIETAQEPSQKPESSASGQAKTLAGKRRRQELNKQISKFSRGPGVKTKNVKDKRLKGQLQHTERLAADATRAAAKASEWLLPEQAGTLEAEGMERTWRFSQEDLAREVQNGAAAKVFDLHLPHLGPYSLDFTRNGRHMLIAGRKGHLAIVDWQRAHIITELQVKETTRDVKFLHNETFFAAAQRKYVYIYDKRGVEIHCLRDHLQAKRLEFLPYHFLLASIGEAGVLRYQDTSTGRLVAQLPTRLGTCNVMRQNPWNACLALGHPNGVVTMWSPNVGTPLVKMLCHGGPVTAVAFDGIGQHMLTTGVDGDIKVFDVRTFKMLHRYFSHAPVTSLDVSQRGLFASGFGKRIQVWKDALPRKQHSPYMNHTAPAAIQSLRFCPYEDVVAIGHADGISTMLVPGAGEPNFDSRVADPFQGKHARQEQEVRQLLEKLQPEMIVLDPTTIGQVQKEPVEVREERAALARQANAARRAAQAEKNEAKTKMKGKNKPSRRFRKKKTNIIEERKGDLRERIRQEIGAKEQAKTEVIPENVPRALKRFYQSVKS